MNKLKLSKQPPPKLTRQRTAPNLKYAGVYRYVKENPNEWVKIEGLEAREVASIRQYYVKLRIAVDTRTVRTNDNLDLYIIWHAGNGEKV